MVIIVLYLCALSSMVHVVLGAEERIPETTRDVPRSSLANPKEARSWLADSKGCL